MSEGTISQGRSQRRMQRMFLKDGAARNAAVLQLFLTHTFVSGIALVLVFIIPILRANMLLTISTVILISGGLGVLLTANLPYQLQSVEDAVTRMIRKQHVIRPRFAWPLTHLFAQLDAMDKHLHLYIQGEQAAAEIRRHYLEQASESATLGERQRIARDLHDSIKQQLFSISVSAATAKAYWNKDITQAQRAVADIQRVVKEAQVEMQALLQQLSAQPLKNTQLADALRVQAEALQHRSGLTVEIMLGDIPAADLLPAGTQEMIFRIVQEAFSNIARHARAKAVSLTLRQTESALHLLISDNGQGFDSNLAQTGMGLANMRERTATLNGTIEMRSKPGQGTSLHIQIPFIQTLAQREDELRIERELSQSIERAAIGFQIGNAALLLALSSLLVNKLTTIQIPALIFVIYFIALLYGFGQVQRGKRQLILQRGKEHSSVLPLQQKEDRLLGRLLGFLFSVGIWVLSSHGGVFPMDTVPLQITTTVIFYILMLLSFMAYMLRANRTRGQMYSFMEPTEIQVTLTTQRRKVVGELRTLATAALLSVLLLGSVIFKLNQSPSNFVVGILLPIVVVICVGSLLLRDSSSFWQLRRVAKKQRSELPPSPSLGGHEDRQE